MRGEVRPNTRGRSFTDSEILHEYQTVPKFSPLSINSGVLYRVSYNANTHEAKTLQSTQQTITNGYLSAPQGCYAQITTNPTFPTTLSNSWYFTDVRFEYQPRVPGPPPQTLEKTTGLEKGDEVSQTSVMLASTRQSSDAVAELPHPDADLLNTGEDRGSQSSGVRGPDARQPAPQPELTRVTLPTAANWDMTYRDESNRLATEYNITSSGTQTRLKDYFYFGNLMVATNDNTCTTLLYASDHLGTPRLVFDTAGTVREQHKYEPYGKELPNSIYCPTPAPLKFAGMERDTASGNDYDHARFSLTGMARFQGVDLHSGSPGTPTSWNRYSYAAGNPVKFIDSDGQLVQIFGDTSSQTILELAGDAASRVDIRPDGVIDTSRLTAEDLKNEPGATLLNDLSSSASVYNYTEGTTMATAGGAAPIDPLLPSNVDNNSDVRYQNGKTQQQLPPNGVDSAVGINSTVQYFKGNNLVPRSEVAFHELAEAKQKVENQKQYNAAHAAADAQERERLEKCPNASPCTTDGIQSAPKQ